RELTRADALPLGLHEDRRTVLVRARHHQHVVTGHPQVAAEHIGRYAEAGHMADVPGTVRVRPGHGSQDGSHAADCRSQMTSYAAGLCRKSAGEASSAAYRDSHFPTLTLT